MQRYFFELSYDGSSFNGWQIQPNAPSVQEEIQNKLSRLQSNVPVKVVGCGRTDTGVHAHHYILHVDLPQIDDLDLFLMKINRMLPDSIAISKIYPVSDELHARFSATERTYRYFIHTQKDPFRAQTSWYVNRELDVTKMNEAAQLLIGRKDFTSLSKLHTDVKTNICDVRHAKWIQEEDGTLYFEISADRFLRNMVRATVGTLVDVGLGKLKPEDIPTILAAMDRQAASTSVPAHGLFLWKIEY
ncbi:MAG: tRNA pseudouridine(38-40) synthase TruA [Flavobacteriales bacterium]|nr:tRNA pseudouridine(38-40) synthase TruA [Flavobacteriales bacterium]